MEKKSLYLFITMACSSAAAQPTTQPPIPEVLTLEQAVELALARNPNVAAVRDTIEMAEGDAVNAELHPNPALTVRSMEYPYFSSDAGPFFSNQEIMTRFDYELQTRDRLKLRGEAARGAVRREEATFENALRLLRLDVQRAYYAVLLAQSNLGLAENILDQTDQVIDLNRTRYEQGEISELELTRIEVERLRFADDVFQARLEVRNAKAELLALLNATELADEVELVGDLSHIPDLGLSAEAPPAELIRIASSARPDLRAALAEMDRATAQNRYQHAIAAPALTVGGGYQRSGPNHSLTMGVSIPLPIFDRNQGGILSSEAAMRRAGNLAAAVRNRIELQIRQAANALEVNRERVEYIRSQQLQQSEKASQVTLAAYRLGGAPLMDYLDAQRRYRDTMRIYNQALFDERVSRLALAAAVGTGEIQ